jgi:hypothetical protein
MITNSALRLPEVFNASKMAMIEDGEAPVWLIASTTSRKSTPGWNKTILFVPSSNLISAF